ncbi:S24 family peptidase [Aliivibrio sp. S4TY2]|uniref:LexA family protein n=1 Tax=unclassified Aliivibrio TaxID=2645654 RepID=UPI002378F27F|nr:MULTISPECIES: S24 family peptidase [unclassified Aliivibrio]MDD9156978.1 S24 family peptidase [Aliivibrio sp. S4TY2]MDD9160808.1 S24 family peptidase [Aliivibrio sp. S4TY1]MDD9164837.1 S24 family peptidase [Aliivibrio sp. S4MY2]MDD9168888.1 S24 family peptidase [Aliivibrio sp. S4MY4]MDD9185416.1 S24 family peptidase [Aliivibrio sp. S4MY3]
MNWNDLVKTRMKECGITQEILAEKLGKSQGAVNLWLNKKREPSLDDIADIMKEVGLSTIILNSDRSVESSSIGIGNTEKIDSKNLTYKNSFPVISAVQAGLWTEACEAYTFYDIDEYLPTTERVSDSSFWLRVKGDSMTSLTSPSFPEGTAVLVDPTIEPENGKFVVAKLTDENEATFKRLVIDAGKKYLKPLNRDYSMLEINDNCKIIGVVVDAKIQLF